MRPKHNIFSSDNIIVVIIVLAVLLSGGIFVGGQANKPASGDIDQAIITQPQEQSKDNLQLQTFRVSQCASTTAVDFLIDNSGSMQFGTKMPELKNALKVFGQQFPKTGAVALHTYSQEVEQRVPFSIYKDVEDKFMKEVDDMKPLSATHSKDAFLAAQKSLEEGRQKFPNHKFSLIFISDGIPESQAKNDACPGGVGSPFCTAHPLISGACRCYDTDQDPLEIANQIKASGVRIFTVSFIDTFDAQLNTKLQTLMVNAASSPSDYFHAPIENQLTDIITQITTKICSEY